MPNIKISELSAPIAVTDSDLIPGVQSGVTRRLTWGGLKSTLAGPLGRSYLGLGTAAVANVTASSTDTTAGRVLKTGDAGILGLPAPTGNADSLPHGIGMYAYNLDVSSANPPLGVSDNYSGVEFGSVSPNRGFTIAGSLGGRVVFRGRAAGVNSAWREMWTSIGANLAIVDTASFGYGTGSGATAVQPTSKATGVTLNKPSGQITTAGGALAANTAVSFTLTNNKIAANDIPKVVIKSGATAGSYVVQVDAVAAGSCRISIRNMTAGSLSETLVLQFNIEKGAIA